MIRFWCLRIEEDDMHVGKHGSGWVKTGNEGRGFGGGGMMMMMVKKTYMEDAVGFRPLVFGSKRAGNGGI